jgi:two-component system phosphate regulon sensor histidine kinase PhoR
MNAFRSIWLTVLAPAALLGTTVAIGICLVEGNLLCAAAVLAACLASAGMTAAHLTRGARAAAAQLRRPELRDSTSRSTGIFAELLDEAAQRMCQIESAAQEASEDQIAIEAKSHMRKKEVGRLKSALDRLDNALVITDARDRPLFSNTAARDLLTQVGDAEELSSVPAVAQLISDTRTRSAATDHRMTEFEVVVDNQPLAYRATAWLLGKNAADSNGIATIIEDIRDEQQTKTRHAEFVSSVCHEIKTPMASIKAYVELLIDGDVSEPAEQQEFFEFIETQVDRLTRLVDNMLNLARIESGVIELKREDCELNEILDKAFDVVKARADEKSIRLVSELSEMYLPVHPDKDLMGQAIINLLSNAIKYTPDGGEVRLRSRMDEGEAVIEVRDNGMGIPAAALPHLFERFYRVECNNKAAAGTGLGLALVHYIVTELHNGKISVESEVDEGTCFTARIPLGHRNRRPKTEREEDLVMV